MKVTRKEHLKEFCSWYFLNVKEKAKSREMADYALESKDIKNGIHISSGKLSAVMKNSSDVFGFEMDGAYKVWFLR